MAYGTITVATTGENNPLLAGSICSIGVSAIVCTAVSPSTLPRAHSVQLAHAHKRALQPLSTAVPALRLSARMSSMPAREGSAPAVGAPSGPGQGLRETCSMPSETCDACAGEPDIPAAAVRLQEHEGDPYG